MCIPDGYTSLQLWALAYEFTRSGSLTSQLHIEVCLGQKRNSLHYAQKGATEKHHQAPDFIIHPVYGPHFLVGSPRDLHSIRVLDSDMGHEATIRGCRCSGLILGEVEGA
jgi:hypothetical protein